MTSQEIRVVLEKHHDWLIGSPNGERADLYGANLRGANLRGADLYGAKNIPFIPMACPDSGEFIGWKKCRYNRIVKLLIPEDAKRTSATGRKCRASKAIVLAIESVDGLINYECAISQHDVAFEYNVGEIVEPRKPFCEDRFDECSSGIHFFINRQEAVEY